MVAAQLEYRLTLPKRIGLVGFGGLGEVVPGSLDQELPASGGRGLRFELSKKYQVNLRVDIAQGIDAHTWSVGCR